MEIQEAQRVALEVRQQQKLSDAFKPVLARVTGIFSSSGTENLFQDITLARLYASSSEEHSVQEVMAEMTIAGQELQVFPFIQYIELNPDELIERVLSNPNVRISKTEKFQQ